jgi:hypothetical protein
MGNMIGTFAKDDLDQTDPWGGSLAATMFAMRATYSTTMQATSAQLVLGHDAILNKKLKKPTKNASMIMHGYHLNDK